VRAQVKLEQDLAMKAQEEEAAFLHRFRANPLPRSSVEPRFQAIVDEQMRKREEAAEVNMAALRSQERPFTFYYRCAPAARRRPWCSLAALRSVAAGCPQPLSVLKTQTL